MNPTPEQIAAMEARGWDYDAEVRHFYVRGSDENYGAVLMAYVMAWNGAWMAGYGTTGHSFDRRRRHPTPEAAANEAEAWLRGVLAGFRFSWLTVATP